MSYINQLLRLTAVLLLSVTAGVAPAWADIKVGFVNTPEVVERAPQAEAATRRLQLEFADRDRQLASDQERLKRMEEQLLRAATTMSDDERARLEREVISVQRDVRRSTEEFTEDFNLARNREYAELQRLVANAITELAEERGYDLILESGVVYASGAVDITEDVIERLREKFLAQNTSQ